MPAQENLETLLEQIAKRFAVSFKTLTYNGQSYEILDVDNMTQYLDKLLANPKAIKDPLKQLPLWAKVWPGSTVLETFLRKKIECQGKSILEVGCGCGVFSLTAAKLGFASMIASDIENDALLFTKANVLKNDLGDLIQVCYLDVTKPGKDERFSQGVDLIVASEILYLDSLHRPLLNFVSRHLTQGGKAIFCTDMARNKPHFAKLAAKQFHISEIYVPGVVTEEDGTSKKHLYSLLTLEK